MRRLQKSKSVSWPSDVNLCQVKLFLSEESPSLIGSGAQDHLQAKASWLHSAGAGSVDKLPPGFDGTNPAYAFRNQLYKIPIIQWKCPPKFVFDLMWQVVAGEESNEVECQNQRVMRVLEAVYPRPSAIPPNPSLLMRQEDSHDSNQHTPLVPITPIEEDDTAADTSFNNISQNAVPSSSQSQLSASGVLAFQSSSINNPNPPANLIPHSVTVSGVVNEIITAAYPALSAVMANNIDPDLLVKILSDPNIMEKLGSSHAANTNPHNMPNRRSAGISLPDPSKVHINRTEAVVTSLVTTPCQPLHSPVSSVGLVPNPRLPSPVPVLAACPLGAPVAKDINYYKSLIQQHGSERQQTPTQFDNFNNVLRQSQKPVSNPRSRDLKPKKIMKPCIYFNSSRGCRYGAKCTYQHDVSSQQHRVNSMPDLQGAKRMKMDREITGA